MGTSDDFYGAPTGPGSIAALAAATQPWSKETQVVAVAVALAESGDNPNAQLVTQWEDSRGLWQINTYAHPQYDKAKLSNPNYNAKAAYEISSGGINWQPWSAYTNGSYDQFLPAARIVVDQVHGHYTNAGLDPTKPIEDPSWVDKIPGVDVAKNAASGVADLAGAVASVADWMANPRNLIRTLQIVLGAIGMVIGVIMLGKDVALGGAARIAKGAVS